MAEVTVNIPDPIYALIEKRASETNNTPQGIIIANLAIIFSVSQYNPEKWIKNLKGQDDASQPW